MNSSLVLLLAFGIGTVGGMRSMTAPAVVCWAARLGWLHLAGSPLFFMQHRVSLIIFTLAAAGEFIGDLLPAAPARTTPFPLAVRFVVGFLTGACLGIAGGVSLRLGGIVGAAGAMAGAFGGYYARVGLVRTLRVQDALIAIPEDLFAVGLGLIVVSRFATL
jgi:uncharacterized membrane protein